MTKSNKSSYKFVSETRSKLLYCSGFSKGYGDAECRQSDFNHHKRSERLIPKKKPKDTRGQGFSEAYLNLGSSKPGKAVPGSYENLIKFSLPPSKFRYPQLGKSDISKRVIKDIKKSSAERECLIRNESLTKLSNNALRHHFTKKSWKNFYDSVISNVIFRLTHVPKKYKTSFFHIDRDWFVMNWVPVNHSRMVLRILFHGWASISPTNLSMLVKSFSSV